MKMFLTLVVLFALMLWLLGDVHPGVTLSSSMSSQYPGCQVLKLQSSYSSASEETVIADMDSAVNSWLHEHSSYTLVGKIDSMKSVSSDGELNVYYLVRANSSI